MNVRFFVNEAWRALSRNAAPSIAALVTVMITTIVLGVFIPVTDITTGAANDIRSRIQVDVFLVDGANAADITALKKKLQSNPQVQSVEYVSKEDAKNSLDKDLKGASELLDNNPLPASYRVVPKDPDNVTQITASLIKTSSGTKVVYVSPAIDDVRNGEADTKKILSVTGGVKITMWVLALLLMLTSIVLVANTIRLSLYARRREIEVMRMVGATSWFIRWPFIIEGVAVGFIGGLIAVLLLAVAKQTIINPLSDSYALFAKTDTMSFSLLVLILLVASTAISAIGSGITLRRFLRV
ncbi:MAG: ABC transporter permease [Thermoleophilaceae bacterium]|nr:ABC transporter permease [Thermoleophilaceae bacterium]